MKKLAIYLLLATFSLGSHAAKLIDRIAVQVDDGIILQSEIDDLIAEIKRQSLASGQELPSDNALRVQVTERLISTQLQLQMAQRMGLEIGDLQLDQAIGNIASEQGLTTEKMRQAIEADGGDFASYRERIREEITLGEVQRIAVRQRIQITPQEVNNLVKLIEEQGMQNSQFHVGHILIEIGKGGAKSLESAKSRAETTIGLLKEGKDFKRTAIAASAGPKALEGGDWGYMNINEMPTLFAEVIKGAKKGDIIGPIKSGAGFHIITVFDIKGMEIKKVNESNARHILLKPSPILSEDRAKEMLIEFTRQIESGEASFADLAKQYSEDPGSAIKGGELGWSDPSIYVPAFKDTMASLDTGKVSAPFRSSHGWHIVEVLGRRSVDATDRANTDRAYQLLYSRKYNEQLQGWLDELRSNAFVEEIGLMKNRN